MDTFWGNLTDGRSGITKIDHMDITDYKTNFAGVVRNFDAEAAVGRREVRRMDRYCQFAVAAAKQALDDAALVIDSSNEERIGVYIGSGIGGIQTILDNYRTLLTRGPSRVSPTVVSDDDRQYGGGTGQYPIRCQGALAGSSDRLRHGQ